MKAHAVRWIGMVLLAATMLLGAAAASAQAAIVQPTPKPGSSSCDAATPTMAMPMGTPAADARMGSPAAVPEAFDQLYIEMMFPHHQSIIALAQAALPRLTDPRLQQIAQTIITSQSAEIPKLEGFLQQWYNGAMSMDQATMEQMMQAMPGMGSMDEMMTEMDAQAQIATFCAAPNPDLAFIDLTIPHHQMAIKASQTALTQASHPELKQFAQTVIAAQQKDITELTAIRAEMTGAATPGA